MRNKCGVGSGSDARTGRVPMLLLGCGSPAWTRTKNLSVNSRLLCQLSYRGSLYSPASLARVEEAPEHGETASTRALRALLDPRIRAPGGGSARGRRPGFRGG